MGNITGNYNNNNGNWPAAMVITFIGVCLVLGFICAVCAGLIASF